MCVFKLFVVIGLYYTVQVEGVGTPSPKPRDIRDIFGIKSQSTPKQTFRLSPLLKAKKPLTPKPNFVRQSRQIQRGGDLQMQQTFLGVPVQIENVHHSGEPETQSMLSNLYPVLPKLPAVKPLIKPNETEAERAERIHKSFDRLLTFVEIVGQVDNYVSSKWKNLVKTVSSFYEAEDEPYRVSARRMYGTCPHAH